MNALSRSCCMLVLVMLALVMLAPACSVDVPEGIFGCDVGSDCPPGMVCHDDGRCRTARVDSGGIDAFVPDAGGMDGASVDAPVTDAPVADAPVADAPVADAPAVDGGTCVPPGCDDGDPCTTDSCTAGGCSNAPVLCGPCRRCRTSDGSCEPNPALEHTRCFGGRCCNGACVDIASDVSNCGGCGIVCNPGATCTSPAGLGGVCSCAFDFECPGAGGTNWVCSFENVCLCTSEFACAPTQTCGGAPGAMICAYPS